MSKRLAIVWFRQDLRLADNPALTAALRDYDAILPVYIYAPDELSPWTPGEASAWWLAHSLDALDASLVAKGGGLLRLRGPSRRTLEWLIKDTGADAVYANVLGEPVARRRDASIAGALESMGVEVRWHNGHLMHHPDGLLNQSGKPYRVFTPFYKSWLTLLDRSPPLPAPTKIKFASSTLLLKSDVIQIAPTHPWTAMLARHWSPSERDGMELLQDGVQQLLQNYGSARDRPAELGTSKISPYLHFGEISPGQAAHVVQTAPAKTAVARENATAFVREIAWREFAYYVLHHFPHTADAPMDTRFDHFPWREVDAATLRAWQRGQTGIPMVDAGMRQLWQTGWMHNRVRMIVASFLTKNLMYPWQLGAKWFWDTLVDADLASNSMGWQWTAGCGVDAAPYFRIFNPVSQGEKFDPQGNYVRHWVPELATLPDDYVHQPWAAPPMVLTTANVRLGENYPYPIVDLKGSRERALAAYSASKNLSSSEA